MKFFRFYFLEIFRPARLRIFKPGRSENCGFSIIELMVAVGILILINTIIFASYPEFSQRMALKRTSEEIALIIRQAQAYSLGIKRPASGGDYVGFGIHFDQSKPKSLVLFADSITGTIGAYDAGDYSTNGCGGVDTECFQEFTIDTGDYISELKTCDSVESCDDVPDGSLDIFYSRVISLASISPCPPSSPCSYAKITIKSPRGDASKNKKLIKIWRSGPISVEDLP